MSTVKKILFYAERTLHLPFLEPIEEYLRTSGLAQTAFSAPEFFAGTTDVPQWGLPDQEIGRLRAKAPFFVEPQDFEPDVTVVADACHFRIPHIRHVINVGHGMICKGAFYTDSSIVRRENLSQMLLVPGPSHASRLASNVFIPTRVTGFIKSDQLFGVKAQDRTAFCSRMGIDPAKKIVLFAPTYNHELSAIHCVAEDIRKIANDDTVLLIKLHNLTEDHWKEMYKNIASGSQNIHYLEDADYSGMMHAADLMISDVSSIYIEFLLLDKPVILFNNPRMKEFPLYNAQDIEYLTRDAGVQVDTVEALLRAVPEELAHPERRSQIRQRYAQALDHGRDGQSAARAGQAIMDWICGRDRSVRTDLNVVVLEPEEAGMEQVMADISELVDMAPNHQLRIFIFGGREFVADPRATHVRLGLFHGPELYDRLRASSTPSTVILCGGLRMPYDWPKWLDNHMRWNQHSGAIKALTEPVLAARCMGQLCSSSKGISNPGVLSFGLLVSAIGQSAQGEHLPSECIMIRTALLQELPGKLPVTTPEEFIIALGLLPSRRHMQTLMAMDCYMYPADATARTLRQIKTLRKLGRHQEAAHLVRTLAAEP